MVYIVVTTSKPQLTAEFNNYQSAWDYMIDLREGSIHAYIMEVYDVQN